MPELPGHAGYIVRPSDETKRRFDPLLLSGIALSGANYWNPESSGSTGLVAALSFVGVPLEGTDLVTVSACDSASGEVVATQAALGLRSALIGSGARSVLLSLWKVDDTATREFMRAFYTALWVDKLSKRNALLKAQQTMSAHPDEWFRNPLHWAGWAIFGASWD